MRYLLEEWSLKGGTLTQLERSLVDHDMEHVIRGKRCSISTAINFVKTPWNNFNYNGYIIVYLLFSFNLTRTNL